MRSPSVVRSRREPSHGCIIEVCIAPFPIHWHMLSEPSDSEPRQLWRGLERVGPGASEAVAEIELCTSRTNGGKDDIYFHCSYVRVVSNI